ncbi:MAG: tripartite tricarboxylate transporter substrate binding protein [Xanthobacteraceae bacterium]
MQRCARALAATAFALGTVGLTHATLAADWPSRPIRIIAPSTPGGAADTFARLLADQLGPRLGTTLIVDNRAGGGGLIGMAAAAHAEPDGYTLVTSSIAYNAIEPIVSANPGFDPTRDFTHVAFIGGQPDVFLVSTKSGLRSLKDVVELARRGAPPNYVSPGLATFSQLLVEVFALEAGIKFQHIPHRGSSQAMIDLVAGNVPFGTMTWGSAIGQVRAGTVLPVAISSKGRVAEFPNVPTLHELGYSIIGDSWWGLSGPAGVPPEITRKLNQAVIETLDRPEVRQRLVADAIIPDPMTPEQFGAFVAAEIAKWGPIAKRLGMGQ